MQERTMTHVYVGDAFPGAAHVIAVPMTMKERKTLGDMLSAYADRLKARREKEAARRQAKADALEAEARALRGE